MKWIVEIKEINNFIVTVLWNDGITRKIDLNEFLSIKTLNKTSSYSQLLDINTFQKVKCDGTTLYWENLIDYQDLDGTFKKGNLDISPELLYDLTIQKMVAI